MFSNAVDLKLEFDQYTYQLSPVHLSNPNELYTDNHAFSDQRLPLLGLIRRLVQ